MIKESNIQNISIISLRVTVICLFFVLLFSSCASQPDKPIVYDNHDLYRRIDSIESAGHLYEQRMLYKTKK